jgi:hypothetical protein
MTDKKWTSQSAIEIINEAMANAQDNPEHAKAVGFLSAADVEAEFCKDYQGAKNMLNMIAPVLAWWPQGGATASLVLKGLIALGDELYKDGCST